MDGTRINVTLDQRTYELLRALSFKKKRTMSALVRESIEQMFDKKNLHEAELVMDAEDEEELIRIRQENDYSSWEDLKKQHGL